ncbi:MAG: hypothetical protein ACFB9M_15670 [Myxococcota bacterium]
MDLFYMVERKTGMPLNIHLIQAATMRMLLSILFIGCESQERADIFLVPEIAVEDSSFESDISLINLDADGPIESTLETDSPYYIATSELTAGESSISNQGPYNIFKISTAANSVSFDLGCSLLRAKSDSERVDEVFDRIEIQSDSVGGRSLREPDEVYLHPLVANVYTGPGSELDLISASLRRDSETFAAFFNLGAPEEAGRIVFDEDEVFNLSDGAVYIPCRIRLRSTPISILDIYIIGQGSVIPSNSSETTCVFGGQSCQAIINDEEAVFELDVFTETQLKEVNCAPQEALVSVVDETFPVQVSASSGSCEFIFESFFWRAEVLIDGTTFESLNIGTNPSSSLQLDLGETRGVFEVGQDIDYFDITIESTDVQSRATVENASGSCVLLEDNQVRIFRGNQNETAFCDLDFVTAAVASGSLVVSEANADFTIAPNPDGTGTVECLATEAGPPTCLDGGVTVAFPLTYELGTQVTLSSPADAIFTGDCDRTTGVVVIDGVKSCGVQEDVQTPPAEDNGDLETTVLGAYGSVDVVDANSGAAIGACVAVGSTASNRCTLRQLPRTILLTPSPDGGFSRFARFEPPDILGPDEVGCPARTGPGPYELDLASLASMNGQAPRDTLFRCHAVFDCTALTDISHVRGELVQGSAIVASFDFGDPDDCAPCVTSGDVVPAGTLSYRLVFTSDGVGRTPDTFTITSESGNSDVISSDQTFVLTPGAYNIAADIEFCGLTSRLTASVSAQ